jgi:hypothetical protein
MISADRLRELLDYDKKTGELIRRSTKTVAGSVDKTTGYRRIRVDGERDYAHRLAYLYKNGNIPDGVIDHIDHNRDNNRLSNLRAIPKSHNNRNRLLLSNNTSGASGVYKAGNKWRAVIGENGKRRNIGNFNTLEEARSARSLEEKRLGYSTSHGVSKEEFLESLS